MDKKVVDYHLVHASYYHTLTDEVKRMINAGWQPQGGISHNTAGAVFLQAMVRYE